MVFLSKLRVVEKVTTQRNQTQTRKALNSCLRENVCCPALLTITTTGGRAEKWRK